jgi:hypothetical protein
MRDAPEFMTVVEVGKHLGMKHPDALLVLERRGLFPKSQFRALPGNKRPRRCYPVEIAKAAIEAWVAKETAKRRLKELAQLTAATAA